MFRTYISIFIREHIWDKWTKCQQKLTDALNEAVDNVRFLDNLRPFVKPLYEENFRGLLDSIPHLYTSLKMILTISRHYR